MSAHAELGPSSADRWMVCTASVDLIADMRARGALPEFGAPEEDEEEWSAEGTGVHEIRAKCLTDGTDPFAFVGKEINVGKHTFIFTEAHAEGLLPGIDWLRERLDEIEVELRVRLDPWMPEQFGTLDSGGVFDKTLVISDYKNGVGRPVKAAGNRQLRIYGLGYWHRIGRPLVERVIINVDQPNAGGMKFWEIHLNDLLAFGREVEDAFMTIRTGKGVFAPGEDTCWKCPARDSAEGCPAFNRWMHEIFLNSFDQVMLLMGDPVLPDIDLITPEQRWQIVKFRNLAKAWLDAIYEQSLKAGLNGNLDPGSKIVAGKPGNRKFSDPGAAESIAVRALGLDAYKRAEILSVAELESKLKPRARHEGNPEAWEALKKLIERAPGNPMVTDAADPRPPYGGYTDDFEDL